MKIIVEEKYNKLQAEEGKVLRVRGDEYIPEFVNIKGEHSPEYCPPFYDYIYVPQNFTEQDAAIMYEEKDPALYPWKDNLDTMEGIWDNTLINNITKES